MDPIFNPNGPNKKAVDELIEALSTALDSPIAGNHAREMIEAIKEGYKIQSGEDYIERK